MLDGKELRSSRNRMYVPSAGIRALQEYEIPIALAVLTTDVITIERVV